MKRIGVSLPFVYLAGQTDQVFYRLFGPVSSCLTQLKARGATSIELRVLSPHTDAVTALAVAEKIWGHGLELSIHGSLPDAPIGDDLSSFYPGLDALAEPLVRRQQTAVIALHAYQRATGIKAELADQSVDSLGQMMTLCDRQQLPFTFAVELNRSREIIDPAASYEGVEAIRNRVENPRLGICWDFGHGYSNVMQGLCEPYPPSSFLERVTHTHIHDIGPSGKTHWPLTENRLPLAEYVRLLESVGYKGIWNLELDPSRYEKEEAVAERILQSIDILRGG